MLKMDLLYAIDMNNIYFCRGLAASHIAMATTLILCTLPETTAFYDIGVLHNIVLADYFCRKLVCLKSFKTTGRYSLFAP